MGVSTPTIQGYESGEIKNIRKDKIKALSDALRVTPSFLMDWEETAEAKQSFDYILEMQLQNFPNEKAHCFSCGSGQVY